MRRKKALVLGCTGQDGSYLCEYLLNKNYEVHGLYRRSSTGNLGNLSSILDRVTLHKGDMADPISISRVIGIVGPEEIYNEADQDNIDWSYATADYSSDITYAAVGRLLEIVRKVNPLCRILQPISATIYGDAPYPQNEESDIYPMSPYACAKAGAYHLCRYYRKAYGLFVSTAILYNHVSVRRQEEYVIQKICNSAVRIVKGLQPRLSIGDLSIKIDIGYAPEVVKGLHSILQLEAPDDYVMGTGVAWTIGEIVEEAFRVAGIQGDKERWLTIDPAYIRPGGSGTLIADSRKAFKDFGWSPRVTAGELIYMFVEEAMKKYD